MGKKETALMAREQEHTAAPGLVSQTHWLAAEKLEGLSGALEQV